MGILLKRIVLIFTTAVAFSTIVLAVAEPADETRSLAITAGLPAGECQQSLCGSNCAAMKGVGLKTAKAIVAYRKANGPFKTINELTEVKGIGVATLRKNERVIALE